MAHKLEKIYNAFGGLDTRSNRLQMDSKTLRAGSKNFRFDFQDQWTKANGFQHKALASGFTSVGDLEYKYTDLDSGESKTQYLCVGSNGKLYRKDSHLIKFSNLGTSVSYSFYYDDILDTYIFKLNSYAAINVSDSMTMDQLRVAINALGATCTIVDDDEATVTGSTRLAYYIDVVIAQDLEIGVIQTTSSWLWNEVDYPSKGKVTDTVPFITTRDYYTDSSYEGISYINQNNVCYITDGGFPLKYDGKEVYRAGFYKVLKPDNDSGHRNLSGFSLTPAYRYDGEVTPGVHQYLFRYGYIDAQGSSVYGTYDVGSVNLYMKGTSILNVFNLNTLAVRSALAAENFPVYSCMANGNQDIATAGGTITVFSNHNIRAGMVLRIPVSNAPIAFAGFSYIYSKVTSVTSTTITLQKGLTGGMIPYPFTRSVDLVGAITSGSFFITDTYITLNGTTTIGSRVVTGISSTANIRVGDVVNGLGVGPNYLVTLIDSSTQVTLNTNATASGTVAIRFGYGNRAQIGDAVTGPNIPANTVVTSVTSQAQAIGISNAPSVTASSQTFTFREAGTLLANFQVLNGGYAQEYLENTISNPNTTFPYNPEIQAGSFIEVYRTTAGTDSLYKLIDLPMDSDGTIYTFNDTFSDSTLSRIAFIDANQGSELPRACKYLTVWQEQIVQCGRPINTALALDSYPSRSDTNTDINNSWGFPDTEYMSYLYTESHLCDEQSVYWNDPSTPEGFPQDGLFEFLIESKFNDRVTGASANKDALFGFKERSTGVLVGSLAENNLSIELLEADVGCGAHRSIQEIHGSLIWLDSVNGFYLCVAGRLPVNIGWPISDYQKINSLKLDFTQAVSANFRKESLYICAVGSTTFVFDYANTSADLKPRNAWYLWDRFNTRSLLANANDELILNDGTYSWKMKVTNTRYDDTDHKSAIDWIINLAWLNQNLPTIDKHYLNLWLNSIQGDFALTIKQYGNYLEDEISSIDNISFKAEADDKNTIKEFVKAAIPKLSSISFGLINSEKNRFLKIQGLELEHSIDFDSGEPKR